MNAHALLTSQGWRGTGHSLHKTDDSIGLAKPILVSKKSGNKGLGQKQHFTSDQWWMNAFDEQLKGLDTSKKGKVVQTVTTGRLNAIERQGLGKWSLYASFVPGGFLEGTLHKLMDNTSSQDSSSDSSETKEAKKKKKKKSKQSKSPDETPEERRARKEARRKRKEERATRRAARRERKKKSSAEDSTTDDAREEKRRRRAKKEEKRRKRKLDALKSS